MSSNKRKSSRTRRASSTANTPAAVTFEPSLPGASLDAICERLRHYRKVISTSTDGALVREAKRHLDQIRYVLDPDSVRDPDAAPKLPGRPKERRGNLDLFSQLAKRRALTAYAIELLEGEYEDLGHKITDNELDELIRKKKAVLQNKKERFRDEVGAWAEGKRYESYGPPNLSPDEVAAICARPPRNASIATQVRTDRLAHLIILSKFRDWEGVNLPEDAQAIREALRRYVKSRSRKASK